MSAWHTAWVSALSFTVDALVPLLAILLPPENVEVPVTFLAVLLALAALDVTGARLGDSPVAQATVRVAVGGAAALTATFLVGQLLAVQVWSEPTRGHPGLQESSDFGRAP